MYLKLNPLRNKMSKQLFLLFLIFFLASFTSAQTIEHTQTTDTVCNDGICTKTLYSGVRNVYEDNTWKKIEEARSLKDSGFNIVTLEDDKDFLIDVVDFNYTSITVRLNPAGLSIFPNSVPVRIWTPDEAKEEQVKQDVLDGKIAGKTKLEDLTYKDIMTKVKDEEVGFNLFSQTETKTYDFGMGKILEFGYNSTTIIVNSTTNQTFNDGYIEASNSDWSTVRNAETGNTLYLTASTLTSRGGKTLNYYIDRAFIYYNTTLENENAIITDVKWFAVATSSANTNITIFKATIGNNITLEDFDSFTGNSLGKTEETWKANSLNNITFNEEGRNIINKTGITKICIRDYEYDTLGTIPNTSNLNNYYSSENIINTTYLVIEYLVDTSPPSVTSLTESPSEPALSGGTYEFNATITDDTAIDTVLFQFDGTNYTASNISSVYNVTLTGISAGTYDYLWWANDTGGYINNSEDGSYEIIDDTSYPIFTNIDQSPPNNTQYQPPTINYFFNVTITFTNGTAGMEFEGNNVTLTETEDGLYPFSGADLSAGTYEFYYWAYGNGTTNLYNTSGIQYYTIAENTGNCNILFDETSPLTYPNTFRVYSDCTSAFQIYRDGASVENNSLQSLGAGTYTFEVNRTDTTNYTNTYDTEDFTINQVTTTLSFVLTPSNTETYPTETTATGSGCPSQLTCNLYRDGVEVSNPETITLGAGTYTYIYNTTGNSNYTSDSETDTLTINQVTTTTTLITDPITPITYGTASTFTCSNDYQTPILYIDSVDKTSESGVAIVRSAGTYNVSCIYAGNQNYTADADEVSYTINKATPTLSISGTTPITYGTSTDVAGSGCPSQLTCALNIANAVYGVESSPLMFNYSTEGNINYTSASANKSITINQYPTSLTLGITPSSTVTYGTETTATGSGCPSQLTCNLYRNNVLVSTTETETFGAGSYPYIYNTSGNANYTIDSDSATLIVNKALSVVHAFVNNTRTSYSAVINDSGIELLLNGTLISGAGNLNLTLNGTLINQGASPLSNTTNFSVGVYTFIVANEGNENYSVDTDVLTITLTLTTEELQSSVISDICDGSDLSFLEASVLAGVLMTIILIGGVIAILFMSFSGVIDLEYSLQNMDLEKVIAGLLIIGLTFIVIATMAYLIGGNYCPSIGG